MSDRSVQDFIDVAQKAVFIDFNLLGRLLNNHNFGIPLVEPAHFSLNLEEAVFFTKLESMTHVRLSDQSFKRNSILVESSSAFLFGGRF